MTTRTTILLVAAAAAVGVAGPAQAGPPGRWTQVTPPGTPLKNIDEIAIDRDASAALHLAWRQGASVMHRRLEPDLETLDPAGVVTTYPSAVNGELDIEATGDVLHAYFAGLAPGQPHDSVFSTATSSDGGATWSPPAPLGNTSTSGRRPAYASNGIAALHAPDGRIYSVWGSPGMAAHIGQDPADPDVPLPGGSSSDPGVAYDGESGQVFAAWNLLDEDGVAVMPLSPLGQRTIIPSSGAAQLQSPVAISGRVGQPGVYVAYTAGTNEFLGRPAIFPVGAERGLVLARAEGARQTSLAATASGRLWVFWHRRGTIYARRSNGAVTAWSAPIRLTPPRGTEQIHGLVGNGMLEPLDVVARFGTGGTIAGWHQRIRPRLTVRAKVARGRVTITVLDVGDAVKGATVRVRGVGKRTGTAGTVRFRLGKGRHRITASTPYGGRGTGTLRVR